MSSWQVKKLPTPTIIALVLFGLVSPIMGIDHPVEPFQKAKALALTKGVPREGKYGKTYILMIQGWGAIIYVTERDNIALKKG